MTHAMLKGSNVPLDATAVRAVLRWTPGPGVPDVDASALLLGPDGRVRSDEDFVFYNQPRHPSGQGVAARPRSGSPKVSPTPSRRIWPASSPAVEPDSRWSRPRMASPFDSPCGICAFCCTTPRRRPTAAQPPWRTSTSQPETGQETAMICGELYRRGDGWKFRAVGQGYPTGLVGLATDVRHLGGRDRVGDSAAAGTAARARRRATGPGPPASRPPQPPFPPPPQTAPPAAYGYPLQAPAAPRPAYGYPQPSTAPAYGYPQPAAAAAPAPDRSFGCRRRGRSSSPR